MNEREREKQQTLVQVSQNLSRTFNSQKSEVTPVTRLSSFLSLPSWCLFTLALINTVWVNSLIACVVSGCVRLDVGHQSLTIVRVVCVLRVHCHQKGLVNRCDRCVADDWAGGNTSHPETVQQPTFKLYFTLCEFSRSDVLSAKSSRVGSQHLIALPSGWQICT